MRFTNDWCMVGQVQVAFVKPNPHQVCMHAIKDRLLRPALCRGCREGEVLLAWRYAVADDAVQQGQYGFGDRSESYEPCFMNSNAT